MGQLFAVIRSRGPAWNASRPLEGQKDWESHASFMNALQNEGCVVLGGPLEGTSDVLIIVRADTPEEVGSRLSGIRGPPTVSSASAASTRGRCDSDRCREDDAERCRPGTR
jgi:hypothetical protein